MSRGFVCSRRGETRYLSARENVNSSEKNLNLDDGIHNFDREMNTGWFPPNHSGSVNVIGRFGRLASSRRRANLYNHAL